MAFKRNKIAIVGAGFTGATTALMVAQRELGDVVLIDTPSQKDPTQGKALDLLESGPVQGFHAKIRGTSDYQAMQDADMVLVTAGIARKPGMSRDELLQTNTSIMKDVSEKIAYFAPNSYVIVLSNPVDTLTYVCFQTTGFPKNRVIGQSGILDTARFTTFVAEALNISIKDITSFVLGGHGDPMVPMIRYSYAGGIPIDKLLSKEKIEAIVERTRKGGGEIVSLLGEGSAYYAPAASIVKMVQAIIRDEKRIVPSVSYLEGEYGYENIYLGVPTILGGNGIESVIELPLDTEEKYALDQSARSVEEMIEKVGQYV